MGIASNYRKWRRARIIKAMIAEGLKVPSDKTVVHRNRRVHWLKGDYTLRNSELLFAAVSRIANSFSSMPIQLYNGSTPVADDLNDLLSLRPNPSMSSCSFFKTLEACRCTSGNCYALKVMDSDDALVRLDVLDPERVTPIMEQTSKEMWYKITPEDGSEFYIHNYYMIHVPFISTNGYSGVNPVSVLFDTLSYSEKIQHFSLEQLEEGVNAAIVLEAPSGLGDQQKKDMIDSFMQTYKETSGNILLLESGVTARPMNLSPVDTKLFEVEKITRSKVAMVYNIPPHLLGDYSDTSFSSQEQQMLEFLQLTMLPIVTAYEQELNYKLLTKAERQKGLHFVFDMDAILRADAATMAEVNYKGVRSGWILPDEVRYKQHNPPLPNGIGSHALVSQDLATLDYTVNQKPSVLARAILPNKEPPDEENE